jgi:uncharacterized protein YkwD
MVPPRTRIHALSIVVGALALACSGPLPDPAAHCPMRDTIECASDIGGLLPFTMDGTTSDAADGQYSGSRCGIGGGTAVDDAAFRWTAPHAGTFRFSTEGSSFDTILSVRAGSCGAREATCNDDAGGESAFSVLTMTLDECETITLVVDGHDADGVGAYRLSITESEASCDDGTDDDADGLVDCMDPDCFGPRCDVNSGDWPSDWAALEASVLELTNQHRAEGATCDTDVFPPAPPLERDVLLEQAARLHSLDMAEQSYFSHDSLDGRTFTDRIDATGFTGAPPVGENIASGQATAEEVVDGWMASPGHCRNIKNASYHVLGVGYAEGSDGTRWTQDFGGSH